MKRARTEPIDLVDMGTNRWMVGKNWRAAAPARPRTTNVFVPVAALSVLAALLLIV